MITLNQREVLLYFALKYNGNWDEIYESIKKKLPIIEEEYQILKSSLKSNYFTILDTEYPLSFKGVNKPPFVIFYYGDINLLNMPKITVVGSRDYSAYGSKGCQKICKGLATNYVIVSGLARGIDSVAHLSALEASGKTIAILGSGIDCCYPKQNQELYETIKKDHLLLSEYPNDLIPQKENFPRRNRLLATLGDAIFIPECKNKSGTLITITLALSYGKTIYVLPFPINIETMNNQLIKEGATLVESADDIIEDLK